MKIAIISDVHSNLIALKAVLKDIEEQDVKTIYCLGDSVGYGPHPLECLKLVLKMCKVVLMGNHEDCLCNPRGEMELNHLAAEGIRFSRSKIPAELVETINNFPILKVLDDPLDIVLCHGSYTGDSLWNYIDCEYKAKNELKHTPKRICFVGHTHTPFVFGGKHGSYKDLSKNIELNPKEKFIINVGSVGQPRDRDPKSSYAILTIDEENLSKYTIIIRRVSYDISKVEKAMKEYGISPYLAQRLYSGD